MWRKATTGKPLVLINNALQGTADRDLVHVSDEALTLRPEDLNRENETAAFRRLDADSYEKRDTKC